MVLGRAIGWSGLAPDANVVALMHRGIFEPVFGDRTLGLRARPKRGAFLEDDGVVYPVWVVEGTGRTPQIRTMRGVRASNVRRRTEEACRLFARSAPDLQGDIVRGAEALARLYVRLIRVHPFGDGNGRTAWAVTQMAAGRLHLPFVQSTPTASVRLALGDAIRDGTRIEGMSQAFREALWPGVRGDVSSATGETSG